ncbi:archaeosortase A [Halolamina sediminis]|uniref:archaeosortase A n=1 Tax=Halolamina sediminis TaxID=1480675 RepID=UPI0006B50905|nr:archaeosortase A [Halolamina sediminis]
MAGIAGAVPPWLLDVTDVLAWIVIGAFALGAALEILTRRENDGGTLDAVGDQLDTARTVSASAWGLFALFWLLLFPHFAFVHKSYVEGVLALVAVPACLYAGYLLWAGRDTLFLLSRSTAIMGLIYLPFETIPAMTVGGLRIPAPRQVLIEIVAAQTGFMMSLFGSNPELIPGPQGYQNTYEFVASDGQLLQFSVVLACTGLGSIAIFAGLITAVRAPLRRKLRALSVAVPIIYGLNLVRTTFIGIAFGEQLLQIFPNLVLTMFGGSDPYRVSWYVSDRIISQLLAVVALVGVTYLVVRELPEILTIIEDVLFMVTGDEYDLAETLDLPRSRARTQIPESGD